MTHLLVAHPGHELLLYGWISRMKPVVHVLTDGSGHGVPPRIAASAELVRASGAAQGRIFGRLSDREAYAMILERDTERLLSLAAELAGQLETEGSAMLVHDAAEGYNPVHDLCQLIAGSAIALAGVAAAQYEYPVVGHPHACGAAVVIDLDPGEHAAKMARARRQAAVLPDIEELLSRYGAEAYRRETFRRVADWTAFDRDGPPLYERYGEERRAAGRYHRVIRQREHMLPLRDVLRAEVEKRSCAS